MTGARTHAAAARPWPALLALLVTGCVAVTVNVNFPQETIDNAASGIEDVVRSPAPPPPPKRDGAVPAPPLAGWRLSLGPSIAEAQPLPELKTRTPEIMAVIESRRARYPELSAALKAGCLGENNQGLLEARPGEACPGNVAALAAAENRDRMVLYRTLVEQNNMPAGDLARVQAGFARAHRDRAPAGAWVQNEGGRWSRK